MQQHIFLSEKLSLRVSFPKDKFGLGEDMNKEPCAFPHVKFQQGVFITESEEEVQRLEKHPGYKVDYIKQESSTDNILHQLANPIAEAIEGGIPENVKKDLQKLDRLSQGFIAPQKKAAVDTYRRVCDSFSVGGLPTIEPSDGIRKMVGAINSLLSLLEDQNLIDNKIYERQPDS
jgi:hypothetical protein